MSRAETANRRTLFQDLRSAEETAHAYRKLWAEALSLAAYADRGSVLRGVAEREAARLLNRHGLADIPDTPLTGWPAPTGRPFFHDEPAP